MNNPALVVQCFIKTDTLQDLCNSLVLCTWKENFDLVFWCDNATGSSRETEYKSLNEAVLNQLSKFSLEYGSMFSSCNVIQNPSNLGTCQTCKVALDRVFSDHEIVIFSEDDTVFSSDALSWFLACFETEAFSSDRVWAIAGESIFFDSRRETVDQKFRQQAKAFAQEKNLYNKFVEHSFVPSTCFATTSEKWEEFSQTRGQPLGDEDLCNRCTAEGKTCIFPIVARVKDVGMLHQLGYSVSLHTKSGVREIKNTYLMSEDIQADAADLQLTLMSEGTGELFERTTKLSGFSEILLSSNTKAVLTQEISVNKNNYEKEFDTASRSITLEKTLSLIAKFPPGTYVPEGEKVYDEDEIKSLGSLLSCLMYAPSQIRKKIETYGASIVPANYYSEVPTQLDIEEMFLEPDNGRYDIIFNDSALMIEILMDLTRYSKEFNPDIEQSSPNKFAWKNSYFSYSDAMALYSMIRKIKPKTIIEIGCGWSTLVADSAIQRNGFGRIICIEPYPCSILSSILSVESIIKSNVQSIDIDFFNKNLDNGDILFIDSTHTVKAGSDCIRLYLEVLPQINKNITVHVHDIKLPYMLSKESMRDNQIYWTEQYLLYAYMLNNRQATAIYGSNYHFHKNRDLLKNFMHGRYGEGGGSFWFEHFPISI